MEGKHSVSISEKLYLSIKEYCQLNNLKLNTFVEELITKSFNIERFGEAPFAVVSNKPVEENPIQKVKPLEDDYSKQLDNINSVAAETMPAPVEQVETVVETPKVVEPKKRKITKLN